MIEPYICRQPDLTSQMRAVLVDWLVEVQENFELNHETLYLAGAENVNITWVEDLHTTEGMNAWAGAILEIYGNCSFVN